MADPLPHSVLEKLADDPCRLVELCWPHLRLYDREAEIMLSVRDNRETFVPAATEMGKTLTAALTIVTFFISRSPCRIVTTSSGETQLKNVLWGEIHRLIQTSVIPLGLRVTEMGVQRYLKDGRTVDPLSYIIGHVAKSEDSFAGHHLPADKPRVMLVIDEASGVEDRFFHAADSWAHRKLVIGNPLNAVTFFCRMSELGDMVDPAGEAGLLRKVIFLSAEDSPNVRLGKMLAEQGHKGPYPVVTQGVVTYADYLRRLATWDEYNITTRLMGRFYKGGDRMLYPPEWVARSVELWKRLDPSRRQPRSMGVDTAEGRDLTCWTVVDPLGMLHQEAEQTIDTMKIAGRTIQLMREWQVPAERVLFDRGGGGKQITDRLHEQHIPVRMVSFGESATPQKRPFFKRQRVEAVDVQRTYKNRRAELYGVLRDVLNPDQHERGAQQFALMNTLELLQELSAMPLLYDSEGKMQLPPKRRTSATSSLATASLEEILGRSPDRADSLVLAVFAMRSYNKPRVRVFSAA